MPFVLLGYPTQEHSVEVCKTLIKEGVHGLELGFPFRDPVADGPVLQEAAGVALDNGFKLEKGVDLVRQIRSLDNNIPLTGMGYYNMISVWGPEKFLKKYSEAGLDGLLIPDLPPEYAYEIAPLAEKYKLGLVFIASPNTSQERIDLINKRAQGFIYVVTKYGITGVDDGYHSGLTSMFKRLHSSIDLPLIAGFGISSPEQAKKVIESGADGIITGSRLAEIIKQDYEQAEEKFANVTSHTRSMLDSLKL